MAHSDTESTGWFKSSRSGADDKCVQVRFVPGGVEVRHSIHNEPRIFFTRDEWEAFLQGVQLGEFSWRNFNVTAPDTHS